MQILNTAMDFNETLHKGSARYVDVHKGRKFCPAQSSGFQWEIIELTVLLLLYQYRAWSVQHLLNPATDFDKTIHIRSTSDVGVHKRIKLCPVAFKGNN